MTTRTRIGTGWQEGTFAARSITYSARSVTAGSLIVLMWRYENQASPVGTNATDGTTTVSAGGGQFFESGGNPTAGVAIFYNHASGSKTFVVNFSADCTFQECWAEEWTGLSDSANPVDTTATGTGGSLTATAASAGIGFAVIGNFSNSEYTFDGSSVEVFDATYSGYAYQDYATSGSKTMSATGGSGASNAVMVLIKDPTSSPSLSGSAITGGSGTQAPGHSIGL
jgi:hypothetical protein